MLKEGVSRILFSAAVMTAVVWLLLAGQPLGGLVVVPAAAILLRRSAESGRMGRLAHRLVQHR